MHPDFDEQKYGTIVRKAYPRLIQYATSMLEISFFKQVQLHRERLEDSNWSRETIKRLLDEGRALQDSVDIFGRRMDNFLALKAAHANVANMPDKKVDLHVFKSAHRIIKLLAEDRLNAPCDDSLIRLFDNAVAK